MSFAAWCLWHASEARQRFDVIEQAIQRRRIVREREAAVARAWDAVLVTMPELTR